MIWTLFRINFIRPDVILTELNNHIYWREEGEKGMNRKRSTDGWWDKRGIYGRK